MRMRAAAAVAATKGAVAASTKLVMFATQAAPGRLFLASPPRLKVRHWSARLGLVACWLWHRGALSPVRRLCLILLWCLWASACWGQDHIVSRSVLEDRNADLTLAQVSRQAMAPAPPILVEGYQSSAYWLRLVVRPPEDGGGLMLRIRPAFLDQVTLYSPDPDHPGRWTAQITGDRLAYEDRRFPSVALGFQIQPRETTTYYLRLKTASSSLMEVEALTPRDFYRKDVQLDLMQVAYFGLMSWILFWSLAEFWQYREGVVGWFALFQAGGMLFNAAVMGYLAPLFPHSLALDRVTSMLVCLVPVLTFCFHRRLFQLFSDQTLLPRIYALLIGVGLGLQGLLALGQVQTALKLNALMVVAMIPLCLLAAILARKEALPGLWLFRAVYGANTLILALRIAPVLGWWEPSAWSLEASSLQGLASSLLMTVFLLRRSQALKQGRVQAQVELALSRQHLETARHQVREQERFIDMLTHEIKTPVGVARISLGALKTQGPHHERIERALGNITALVERCRLSGQLEHQALRPVKAPCDILDLLYECIGACTEPERISTRDEALPEVHTDPQLLSIIIANLLDNGLKYSLPGSSVQVSVGPWEKAGASGVGIWVSNRVPWGASLETARLFSKYYRSPGAQSKSGSGLGLYLSRGIATLLGAALEVVVEEQRVEFMLWLPV